jgi:uncharacterized coiled-coil DUF342 family protein
MAREADNDQFQLLEQKVDALIAKLESLKEEKTSLTEQVQLQENKLSDLTDQLENFRSARDKAKQRIVSLLEKIEQIEL